MEFILREVSSFVLVSNSLSRVDRQPFRNPFAAASLSFSILAASVGCGKEARVSNEKQQTPCLPTGANPAAVYWGAKFEGRVPSCKLLNAGGVICGDAVEISPWLLMGVGNPELTPKCESNGDLERAWLTRVLEMEFKDDASLCKEAGGKPFSNPISKEESCLIRFRSPVALEISRKSLLALSKSNGTNPARNLANLALSTRWESCNNYRLAAWDNTCHYSGVK